MKVVESFPHRVREIEHCWIPMSDGSRLAARIWLPDDAERKPVPAVIEYIPYRKRDSTRWRDEPMHRYFAGHGYAAVRIDLRGSGESDGVLRDEYLKQEQDDGVEAIAWIASQSWCSGAVGMMGKSWGGFNSLQVAARRPPALRAIITVCSTDDRYADDAHYMGGCLLGENLIWGSVLLTINAQPPDPALLGARWRESWLERLERTPLFPEIWLRHQHRDGYWKHGSVIEDYGRIACPVYAVGGWADGYTNAVPRLLAGLSGVRKGLVGPWAHVYPHEGSPGPAIGFLQEALRWWACWLRDEDDGIAGEPAYRVWMQESVPPQALYENRPGRWVAERSWPSPRIGCRTLYLGGGTLQAAPAPADAFPISCPQTVGLGAGSWCGFGVDGEMPLDQREDDAKSLVFESAPLAERLEILGAPAVELEISVDRPAAFLAVRLVDVDPGGASTRVTYGLLNLTHRDGHETPAPLEPNTRYAVRVELNDVAYALPAGHRVRVAISTSYWPVVWPSPYPVTLTVFAGSSRLELPQRPPHALDDELRPFERPEAAPEPESTELAAGGIERTIRRDLTADEVVYTTTIDVGDDHGVAVTRIDDIDLEVGHSIVETFRIGEHDPLSARAEIVHRTLHRRRDWCARVTSCTRLAATRDAFLLEAELEAYEGDTRIFHKRWDRTIRRDGV